MLAGARQAPLSPPQGGRWSPPSATQHRLERPVLDLPPTCFAGRPSQDLGMTSADSPTPASVETVRPKFSAAGATFDIALRMGGLLFAIILVALIFFILKPNSFNVDVGISVLRAMSSVAIMSLGLTLVIVVGEIDLSFGAMYGLGANVLAVLWIVHGLPVYLALILAIGVGALVGLANGALVTWLRIPSFIVTLGSYNLLYGISLWITHTSTFN